VPVPSPDDAAGGKSTGIPRGRHVFSTSLAASPSGSNGPRRCARSLSANGRPVLPLSTSRM
jgi:hypothetical protein